MEHNPNFVPDWIENVYINEQCVLESAKHYRASLPLEKNNEILWLFKAIKCIDLTTLNADDTKTNVTRLCIKAQSPITKILKDAFINNSTKDILDNVTTAAVCVYPSRVKDAVAALNNLNKNIPVASVATGFPTGQYPLETRLKEITYCVDSGAREIDIVLDRSLVISQDWETIFKEANAMKIECRDAHMKTILAVGECGTFDNIYKASMVAMMAGTDFIKTSTGKEATNATIQAGIIMCRAIRDYYNYTGRMVGLKPAGGLKTSNDALQWLKLIKYELGNKWLCPKYFRIGASSLLQNIEERIYFLLTEKIPAKEDFLFV